MWKVAILCLDSSCVDMVSLYSGTVGIVAYMRFRIYYLLIAEVKVPLYKRIKKFQCIRNHVTFAVKLVLQCCCIAFEARSFNM